MSELVQIALIASIAPTISALLGLYVAIQNNKKADMKADTIIEKAEEIHKVTNSNLSKMTKSLAEANERIVGLEKVITKKGKK